MSKKFWSFRKTPSPAIKVDKSELKKRLTPIQYRVTQDAATERPFSGEYLRLKENGMYACVVCGEELFSSTCKYESGCGWPAFYDTEDENKLIYKPDLSHVGGNILLLALKPDLVRTEVTCGNCGAHLGHVFDDGPKPTGKRYCINSASLTFNRVSREAEDDAMEKIQPEERISSLRTESDDKCQKDVIDSPASDKYSTGEVVLLTTSKLDLQKAVRQSDLKSDPVIRNGTSSSSTTAAASASSESAASTVSRAEAAAVQEVRRPASASISQRMRFFTSQRDASSFKADKMRSLSKASYEAGKSGESRRSASDANETRAGVTDSTSPSSSSSITSQKDCRTVNNFTTHPLPPSSTSSSKSSILKSSWFSPAAASAKAPEAASAAS